MSKSMSKTSKATIGVTSGLLVAGVAATAVFSGGGSEAPEPVQRTPVPQADSDRSGFESEVGSGSKVKRHRTSPQSEGEEFSADSYVSARSDSDGTGKGSVGASSSSSAGSVQQSVGGLVQGRSVFRPSLNLASKVWDSSTGSSPDLVVSKVSGLPVSVPGSTGSSAGLPSGGLVSASKPSSKSSTSKSGSKPSGSSSKPSGPGSSVPPVVEEVLSPVEVALQEYDLAATAFVQAVARLDAEADKVASFTEQARAAHLEAATANMVAAQKALESAQADLEAASKVDDAAAAELAEFMASAQMAELSWIEEYLSSLEVAEADLVDAVDSASTQLKRLEREHVVVTEAIENASFMFDSFSDEQYVAVVEQTVVYLVNEYRQVNGLKPLAYSPSLSDEARAWSQHLTQKFPDFTAISDLSAQEALDEVHGDPMGRNSDGPQDSGFTAENLAFRSVRPDITDHPVLLAERLFTQWKNSPGHNSNLLHPDISVMSIGVTGIDTPRADANEGDIDVFATFRGYHGAYMDTLGVDDLQGTPVVDRAYELSRNDGRRISKESRLGGDFFDPELNMLPGKSLPERQDANKVRPDLTVGAPVFDVAEGVATTADADRVRLDQISADMDALQSSLEGLSNDLRVTQAQIVETQAELDVLREQNQRLVAEQSRLQGEADAASQVKRDAQATVDSAQEGLVAAEADVVAASDAFDAAQVQAGKDLDMAVAGVESAQVDLDSAKDHAYGEGASVQQVDAVNAVHGLPAESTVEPEVAPEPESASASESVPGVVVDSVVGSTPVEPASVEPVPEPTPQVVGVSEGEGLAEPAPVSDAIESVEPVLDQVEPEATPVE